MMPVNFSTTSYDNPCLRSQNVTSAADPLNGTRAGASADLALLALALLALALALVLALLDLVLALALALALDLVLALVRSSLYFMLHRCNR